jgi:hypothetical protein
MRFFSIDQPVPRTIIAAIYNPEGFRGSGRAFVEGRTPTLDAEEQRNFFIAAYALGIASNVRLHLEVDEKTGAYKGWLRPV